METTHSPTRSVSSDFHPLLTAGRRWTFSFAKVKDINPSIAVLQWEQTAVRDAADIRSACSANQVMAHSRKVLVWSDEMAELHSLQTPCHLQQPKNEREKCVQNIYDHIINFLVSEKLKTIHSQEEGEKQQCDAGSNKLTKSTMVFKRGKLHGFGGGGK